MTKTEAFEPNTLFVAVSGSGLPEVDGLHVPSTAPPATSESGTVSSSDYWNGKRAWDRADGKAARSPAISYSDSYKSWRISRLDGHLACEIICDDALPSSDRPWNVYKMVVAPAPKVTLYYCDPRQPCPKPIIVFILGGPGAGKGTMCELAEIQLGWTHLSTGDLLRAELQAGGPTTALIKQYVDAGKLVPDEIVVKLLKDAIEKTIRTTGNRNFLIDGFPRSFGNMDAWYAVFGRDGDLPKMIYFECPLEVLTQRILGRAQYSGRSDDNVQSMKVRFETFKAETLPIVEHFKSQGKCFEIDTSQDRQTVYEQVRTQLAGHTDRQRMAAPLSDKAEILLGLRPIRNRPEPRVPALHCPVCESNAVRHFVTLEARDYWRCDACQATVVDAAQLPDLDVERAQYALHRNDPDDAGYCAFLGRLATPLLQRLPGIGLRGLDYGCGPGPALAAMLREAGHTMAVYDPLFCDDPAVLTGSYDFITCTEVAEHFHRPAQEFAQLDRLLKPGGWLGVMTSFTPDDSDFARWYYRRDPTHVVFDRPATFEVLARRHGWRCEIPCANVALLHKISQCPH